MHKLAERSGGPLLAPEPSANLRIGDLVDADTEHRRKNFCAFVPVLVVTTGDTAKQLAARSGDPEDKRRMQRSAWKMKSEMGESCYEGFYHHS